MGGRLFFKKTRTRMPAATLSLVFLPQQILLPDVLDGRGSEDTMNSRRQVGHCLQFVLEFGSVLRRSKLFCVLTVLTLDHMLDPLDNTNQVTCRSHEVILQDFVHPFNRRACDCIILSMIGCPSSCPLGACEVLISRRYRQSSCW
ncbi:hypothetical protein DM02DRAFT_429631 [Periconia macrospinosa]|uniref:Uncharacterized protein n=1 Tax=Periconia macrospinosa TaxID=97972 RepID=A0A2V1DNE6_9PLEO|nr:hypothetical protein DM02DRAFT_429631 [Periconia macrospinosa]